MKCPGCNNQRGNKQIGNLIYECAKCNGIFGECYLGESYNYVLPYMTEKTVPITQTRYYDFTCLSSKGIIRRHGWFDPESKLITQIG